VKHAGLGDERGKAGKFYTSRLYGENI